MNPADNGERRLDALEEGLLRELRTLPPEGLAWHPATAELARLHASPEGLGDAEAARLREHLRSCAPCGDAWSAFTALALEQRPSPVATRASVGERLRGTFGGLRAAVTIAALGAAAAAVLYVLGTPGGARFGDAPGGGVPVADRGADAGAGERGAAPGPLRLVTAEDLVRAELRASEPAGVRVIEEPLEQDEGPRVAIASPDPGRVYEEPFPIDVEFLPGDHGAEPAMETLRVTYKRYLGLDVTDRLREHLDGPTLHVPQTELPEGKHTFEIYIEDTTERATRLRLNVTVEGS